jgi:glycosyltransferase involved in cell wall biosynthesis
MHAWRADDLSAVILMPGRVAPGKGHDVLLRAMAQMANRQATCLIVDRGEDNAKYRDSLLRLIAELGLEGRARFVGAAPDMAVAYMLADVVAVPSRSPEAFNSICAEALAMGRPVVASSTGGTPDIVADGETGWLVPAADPEALAHALDRALALNEGDRVSLAARARADAAARFSLERIGARMAALYQELGAVTRQA